MPQQWVATNCRLALIRVNARIAPWALVSLAGLLSLRAYAQERMLSEVTFNGLVTWLEDLRVAMTQKVALDRAAIEVAGGQEWQFGSTDGQPRAILVTLEGKW